MVLIPALPVAVGSCDHPGRGPMNLFRLPGDPIFDQATYDLFMAVLQAGGLRKA